MDVCRVHDCCSPHTLQAVVQSSALRDPFTLTLAFTSAVVASDDASCCALDNHHIAAGTAHATAATTVNGRSVNRSAEMAKPATSSIGVLLPVECGVLSCSMFV
jgi:hypothetical protein